MDVYDAVATRRAVRAFTTDPFPKQVLQRVLAAAARSPATGNLQPWTIYVVTDTPLAELNCPARAREAEGDPGTRANSRYLRQILSLPIAIAKSRPLDSTTLRRALRARTERRAPSPSPAIGGATARPQPCSASFATTWVSRNGGPRHVSSNGHAAVTCRRTA
jgi:nitroreductase